MFSFRKEIPLLVRGQVFVSSYGYDIEYLSSTIRTCLLPYAVCRMPHAVCLMPYALCRMPYAVCLMPYAVNNKRSAAEKDGEFLVPLSAERNAALRQSVKIHRDQLDNNFLVRGSGTRSAVCVRACAACLCLGSVSVSVLVLVCACGTCVTGCACVHAVRKSGREYKIRFVVVLESKRGLLFPGRVVPVMQV